MLIYTICSVFRPSKLPSCFINRSKETRNALLFQFRYYITNTYVYIFSSHKRYFFSLALGSMVLGQAAPSGEALSSAQGAAYHIFNIIDRVSISNHVQLYHNIFCHFIPYWIKYRSMRINSVYRLITCCQSHSCVVRNYPTEVLRYPTFHNLKV